MIPTLHLKLLLESSPSRLVFLDLLSLPSLPACPKDQEISNVKVKQAKYIIYYMIQWPQSGLNLKMSASKYCSG